MATAEPKYRADAKRDGTLGAIKRDFEDALRNEIRHGDTFLLDVEDARCWAEEYRDYFTAAEARTVFKRALQAAT